MNIRIINNKGRYRLHYVLLDEDGLVDKVLEQVEVEGRDFSELRDILHKIDIAKTQPCVVMNAGNKKMLSMEG